MRTLNFKVHQADSILPGGGFVVSACPAQPWVDCRSRDERIANRRSIFKGRDCGQNARKRKETREREKGGRDRALKSRGIRQAGKWEEAASGRPWGLYEKHFTHKEHPSRVLTPRYHILATNDEREGEKERKKTNVGGLWAEAHYS